MNVIYKGIEYADGKKIKLYIPNWRHSDCIGHNRIDWEEEFIGEIKFGTYLDNEGCRDISHLGFYVECKSEDNVFIETLPDVIDSFRGELVE